MSALVGHTFSRIKNQPNKQTNKQKTHPLNGRLDCNLTQILGHRNCKELASAVTVKILSRILEQPVSGFF